MKLSHALILFIVAPVLVSQLSPRAALADGVRQADQPRPPRGSNPSGMNNVPDERGCVKLCFEDTQPCDPPEFKRTDGRCMQN